MNSNTAGKIAESQAPVAAFERKVSDALEAASGLKVVFSSMLQERSKHNAVYHTHSGQEATIINVGINPGQEVDWNEETLPFFKVRFDDGVEVAAFGEELFSDDERYFSLYSAVLGGYGAARELEAAYVGPYHLEAEGSDADKRRYLSDLAALQSVTRCDQTPWTPSAFRATAKMVDAHVIRVYGFPGARWITQESDEDDGEPSSHPASTADIDHALRFSEEAASLAVKELVNKFPTANYLVEPDPIRKGPETSKPIVWNNTEDYVDASVYVKTGVSEWKFTVSLNKKSGNIYDGEPQFSPSAEESFNSSKSIPPADVAAAFADMRQDAVRLLVELGVSLAPESTLERHSHAMRYLDLFTGHVSEETMDWLSEATPARSHCTGITIAPYEYGVFVGVPEDVDSIQELECADDLKAVLLYARQAGCHVIRFDRDADSLSDLPRFEY